jgi:hypothetical protein
LRGPPLGAVVIDQHVLAVRIIGCAIRGQRRVGAAGRAGAPSKRRQWAGHFYPPPSSFD